MPAPARMIKLGRGCQAMPSRGAKSSFCGVHNGVPAGASVMVARLFTPLTVNGRVPLGDEGAVLYSQRRPKVIVTLRVTFHVSWTNKLQLEKANCTSAFLELMSA